MLDKDGNWCNNMPCHICGGVMVITSWGMECAKCGRKWTPMEWPDWKRCKDCQWWTESKGSTINGQHFRSHLENLICTISFPGFGTKEEQDDIAERMDELDLNAIWGSCGIGSSTDLTPDFLTSRMHAVGPNWSNLMTTSDHWCGQWKKKENETD